MILIGAWRRCVVSSGRMTGWWKQFSAKEFRRREAKKLLQQNLFSWKAKSQSNNKDTDTDMDKDKGKSGWKYHFRIKWSTTPALTMAGSRFIQLLSTAYTFTMSIDKPGSELGLSSENRKIINHQVTTGWDAVPRMLPHIITLLSPTFTTLFLIEKSL